MFLQLCTHPDASQQQGVHFTAILSNRHRSYNRYGRLLLRAQIDRHFPASFFSLGEAGQVCGGCACDWAWRGATGCGIAYAMAKAFSVSRAQFVWLVALLDVIVAVVAINAITCAVTRLLCLSCTQTHRHRHQNNLSCNCYGNWNAMFMQMWQGILHNLRLPTRHLPPLLFFFFLPSPFTYPHPSLSLFPRWSRRVLLSCKCVESA